MPIQLIRANALDLPLADGSVDLVVTSPPYFGLRSYKDGGEHYAGQIGDEATPTVFVDALLAATRDHASVDAHRLGHAAAATRRWLNHYANA